jgi:GntR family transcriptional regulator / MocR family aminotransferase
MFQRDPRVYNGPSTRANYVSSIKPLMRSGGETLREGIYRTLLAAIVDGRLEPGARLPSARELARDWHVSRNTVDDAIGALQAEGLVERRVGIGTRVSSLAAARQPPPRRELRAPSAFGREAVAQLSRWGRRVIATHDVRAAPRPQAFMAALPDIDRFPHDLWRRLTARRLRHGASALARYLPPLGWPPLQQAIARQLAIARGLVCDPDRILVLNSSMQAADLIARVLLGRGDRAWIEDPSFPNLRAALALSGARLVPVPVDEHGLDVAAGRALADDAALAYVTPACHYPLGVTLAIDRRRALLDWAASANAWIVEDDYHSEYTHDGRASAPLASLDRTGRVLFVGSFSHTLFPSLRLAFVVLPAALVDVFAAVRAQLDDHTHGLGQAVLADFMDGGHYAAHLRRMRDVYRARRDALVAASRMLPQRYTLGPSRSGFSVTVLAPAGERSDVALVAHAARHAVHALPLSRYAIGRARWRGLLLGYAGLDERTIRQSMRRLARALPAAPRVR